MCSSDIFLALLAILFPPIAGPFPSSFSHQLPRLTLLCTNLVWIKRGLCSADSLINIALCCLGFFPGLLHAWYIIASYPEPSDPDYEAIPSDGGEDQRISYYYVSRREQDQGARQQQPKPQQPKPQQQQSYGATDAMNAGSSAGGEQVGEQGVPPSYEQAIQGDHKVQT